MENSVWRPRAKIVAIVDLIFSGISLVALIIMLVLSIVATATVASASTYPEFEKLPKEQQQIVGLAVIVTWIMTVLMALVIGVNLWATIKLLNSTELGRDPVEASKMAKLWRLVNIIFLIIGVISHLATLSLITLAISLVIQLAFMFVVQKYIEELDGMSFGGSSFPVGKI